tara:strand:+ start:334 stop:597 length:264 start_codon:yes stop_codon:yes gene_type:complete
MFKFFILLILIFLIAFSLFLYKKLSSYSLKRNYKTILIITLFIIFISISIFFYFIINQEINIDKKYYPPSYDGDKLIPGYFSDQKKD